MITDKIKALGKGMWALCSYLFWPQLHHRQY